MKQIKFLSIFLCLLLLFLAIVVEGCENDKKNPQCYQGKVVSLNNSHGCNNIIEILQTNDNDDSMLTVGARITFNPDLYGDKIELGEIVYFKILEYEEWEGFATTECLWPNFIGVQIEFCNN